MRGKNKTLPTRPEAFWKSSNRGEKLRSLRLGSRRLRRCRSGFWGSRLRWCGCSGLDRIGLIVEAHNVLRDVDLRGSKENRSVLRRGIENDDIAVFAGIAVQHVRSEEHTSELQSLTNLVCRLLLEKKNRRSNND